MYGLTVDDRTEMMAGPERSTAVRFGGDTGGGCKPPAYKRAARQEQHVRMCGTRPETRQHSGPGTWRFDRQGIGPRIAVG